MSRSATTQSKAARGNSGADSDTAAALGTNTIRIIRMWRGYDDDDRV